MSAGGDVAAAPRLAEEPWRLFFPLGVVMAWAGVSHWLFVWFGWPVTTSSAFHSIAQVDGFLWCFVVGFLFTMVPRRTQAARPTRLDLWIGAVVPVLSVGLARAGAFAVSQTIWLLGCIALLWFVVARIRRGGRRAPAAFAWIPLGMGLGVLGAVATAVGGMVEGWYAGHLLGKLLVTQGMVIGLLLGAGSLVLPVMTRGEAPPDAGDDAVPEVMGHAFGALCLAGTFVVEAFVDARSGYALRAVLVVLFLVTVTRAHRVPTLPGWNRWLIWAAPWCIPVGYALAAAYVARPQLGLHLVFAGGLAPLALAVGLHVTLAHGGAKPRAGEWTLGAVVPGLLLAVAAVLRMIAEIDLGRWVLWLGMASIAFLLATAAWTVRAWPALRLRRRSEQP